MYGPLIVRTPAEDNKLIDYYDYDNYNIIISDWDHEMGIDKFLAHYHGYGDNKPPNLLINGLGRYHNNKDSQSIDKTKIMPLTTFNVKQVSYT